MAGKYNPPDQRATLGCGTLILIALIVLIFSNVGDEDIQEDLERMELKIDDLQTAIDEQKSEIEGLRNALETNVEEANP